MFQQFEMRIHPQTDESFVKLTFILQTTGQHSCNNRLTLRICSNEGDRVVRISHTKLCRRSDRRRIRRITNLLRVRNSQLHVCLMLQYYNSRSMHDNVVRISTTVGTEFTDPFNEHHTGCDTIVIRNSGVRGWIGIAPLPDKTSTFHVGRLRENLRSVRRKTGIHNLVTFPVLNPQRVLERCSVGSIISSGTKARRRGSERIPKTIVVHTHKRIIRCIPRDERGILPTPPESDTQAKRVTGHVLNMHFVAYIAYSTLLDIGTSNQSHALSISQIVTQGWRVIDNSEDSLAFANEGLGSGEDDAREVANTPGAERCGCPLNGRRERLRDSTSLGPAKSIGAPERRCSSCSEPSLKVVIESGDTSTKSSGSSAVTSFSSSSGASSSHIFACLSRISERCPSTSISHAVMIATRKREWGRL